MTTKTASILAAILAAILLTGCSPIIDGGDRSTVVVSAAGAAAGLAAINASLARWRAEEYRKRKEAADPAQGKCKDPCPASAAGGRS